MAPVKMKISFPLFTFTYTKYIYIYLKGRMNFLSNHGTHKSKSRKFWRKKLSNTSMAVEA